MHDIRYDEVHDELLVTNPFARAILVFRGGADGNEAPVRIIQGAKTEMGDPTRYAGGPDRLDVDPVHHEIFVADGEKVLVYPRTGNGDIAPLRIIQGPDTQLDNEGTLAVDPVNNVVVVAQDTVTAGSGQQAHILIFDRTANGNTKPRGVIHGPKTQITRINQLQAYGPKGWIVAAQPGFIDQQVPKDVFIGIWSIHDNGDVPPRWKLGGDKVVMLKPRGVVLNPKHKEIMVADMRLNAVLTYYFPEIF
jgi:hypothetical protein